MIVRTAHLKELMGERTWKVTPRTARPVAAGPPDGVERRSAASVGAPLRGDVPAAPRPELEPAGAAELEPSEVAQSGLQRIAALLEEIESRRESEAPR